MRLPHLLIMPMDGASITISAPSIKFLCSHGGKILPCPGDGQLKYVGGETRVVAVAKDISYQQLMKKLSYLNNNGEMILKYQVVSEELDALVSVKCDEDVGHMIDEISNWENAEKSRQLRAFLFPTNPVQEKQIIGAVDPVAMEQRYVDAVNGIVRCPAPTTTTTTTSNEAAATNNYHMNGCSNRMMKMHKVKSSPNICCTNIVHHHQHHVNHHQSPKPALSEKLVSVRSFGHRGNGYYDDCSSHQVPSAPRHAHSMAGGSTFEKI